MKYLLLVFIILLNIGCDKQKAFKTVSVETVVNDTLLNVRAIDILDQQYVYYATSSGRIGAIMAKESGNLQYANYDELIQLRYDSIIPNFRAVSVTLKSGFALSISTPALLFKIGSESDEVVYIDTHPKAFYDSMAFWNDSEGIAIGDPTEGCLSIIITRDGGETWKKLSCDELPKTKEGEAAFAASDSNIAIIGDNTWIATGGMASRVFYSPDRGNTWQVFDTPIIQDKPTTGMYSLDFYDEDNGFAIGGDYTTPYDTLNNKIKTMDGGKTWQVVGNAKSPGYRSCVQYVPNSNARELVAVGFKGIDYSSDAGETWTHLSDEGFYTIRFLNDSVAFAGGKGRVAKLSFNQS